MMRVSATDLDRYRYFRDFDFIDMDAMIADITRTSERTEAMQIGIDFENVLMGVDEPSEYEFDSPRPLAIDPPHAVQVKVEKAFRLGVEDVTLVGKLDAVRGNRVIDWKTTTRAIDYDKYAPAYQWRAYLLMTGYSTFQYDVFQLRKREQHLYSVVDHQTFTMSAYEDMERDVTQALAGYCDLLRALERDGHIVIRNGRPELGLVS